MHSRITPSSSEEKKISRMEKRIFQLLVNKITMSSKDEEIIPKSSLNKLSEKVKSKLSKGDKAARKDKEPRADAKQQQRQHNSKTPDSRRVDKKNSANEDDLQAGIDMLGGSKEDLDLLRGVDENDSDEEISGPVKTSRDPKLAGELKDFFKSLGFDGPSDDESAGAEHIQKPTDKKANKEKKELENGNNGSSEPSETKREKKRRERNERKKLEKEEKERKRQAAAEKEVAENTANEQKESRSLPSTDEFKIKKGSDKINSKIASDVIIEPASKWYEHEFTPVTSSGSKMSDSQIEELFARAKDLLKADNEKYIHEESRSNSQKQFMSQLLSAGTLSDKISALTLLIQESPLHSMRYLDTMLGLCRKKSKGSAMQAVAALKDLCVSGLLPDRKLKWFKSQPLSHDVPSHWLILWAFEDWLKHYYFNFLQQLEQLSHDAVVYIRSNSVLHILDLLKSKPEQEVNLLRLGVNKLGDADRKVASRVSYLLLQLEQAHPAMKAIIVDSIAELMFRSGTDYHGRYYSVITLNQTILAHKDVDVANSLIKAYLQLFERLLAEWDQKNPKKPAEDAPKVKKPRWKNKGNKGKNGGERVLAKTSEEVLEEQSNKLMAAILTGLNRAYPFSKLPEDVFEKHLHIIYRATHSSNFNTTIQALIFLYQVSKSQKKLSDRFARTLYGTLFDPKMAGSSKLRLYLNIVFKTLRDDVDHPERVMAFSKRLLQIATHWLNYGAVTGVEYLLLELAKNSPVLKKAMLDQIASSKEDKGEYDGRARDPLYAAADKTKLWELSILANHFHPTIALYAQGLCGESSVKNLVKPDLDLHTLSHFLDRFVYRNPKQKVVAKGGSIMQPMAAVDPAGSIVMAGSGAGVQPVNAYNWDNINLSQVNVEDRFFYHYFTNKKETGQKKKDGKSSEGDEEVDEDEIWQAIMKSNPEMDGEEDDMSDGDLSMDDYDEDDEDDDSDLEGLDEALSDDEGDISEGSIEESDAEDDLQEESEMNEEEEEDGDDDLSLGDLDDADLIDSDEEVSNDDEAAPKKPTKRNAESESKSSKRRKLKDLPVFASADDYAQYLQSDEEE